MKEIFEQIATDLGWNFEYSRTDFQNLRMNEPGDFQNYLFVDPIERGTIRGEGGGLEARVYSGKFMILRNSDLDEEYDDSAGGDGKYQRYIQDLITEIETGDFYNEISCAYSLRSEMSAIEVVNVFSDNFDGILVTYKFTDYDTDRVL